MGVLGVIFLAGLAFGSFCNVVIRRVPKGRSIAAPPSQCLACGRRIRWHDNIPVVSYILLRGRCRSCGERISPVYPIVELGFGLVLTLVVARYGLTLTAGALGALAFFLTAAGVTDLVTARGGEHETGIIPDAVTLSGLALGLGLAPLTGLGIGDALLGAAFGYAVMFLPAWVYERLTGNAGLGGGDVKMMAMIGAYTGPGAIPFIVLVSALAGLAVGIPAVLVTKNRYLKLPFGPFIALAGFVWIFGGMRIVPVMIRFIS